MGSKEQEDAADIFDDSLSSLFAIPPIAFSTNSPDAYHTYNPPNNLSSIQIRIPQPPAELYTTLQANHLWLAAVYLSDIISVNQLEVNGLRVAELGAGAGLPGVCACLAGAQVVSSDWGVVEVLSVVEDNFRQNCADKADRWTVRGLKWGEDPTPLLQALNPDQAGRQFDALLLADTLWVSEAQSALLDSIMALLRPGGVAHVAAGLHTGRGPVERFLLSSKERGLRVEKVREVRWTIGGGWDEHVVYAQGLEEERGVVVYYRLHKT
jgi:nicotinamide N-methyltransferase